GAKTPDAYAAKAKDTVARGFTALKFDPFPGPWRTHISRDAERQVVETVRAVRDAVGPRVDLLIEVHRRLAPMHAVRIARLLEPFDPFWYEEPVSARDLGALAECRREIRLPIVTGEELYTRFEFRVENGYLALPTGPGLGIELKEDVLTRYADRQFPPRTIPELRDEGP